MVAKVHSLLMSKYVTVIDYGMGNVASVRNALNYLGAIVSISADSDVVSNSESLILPGVGSFRAGIEELKRRKLDQAIKKAVLEKKSKILGICLGMQLLGSHGVEDGDSDGLGLISVSVGPFGYLEVQGRKVPHIGFNSVTHEAGSRLFTGLPPSADFYFVHSFRMMPSAKLLGLTAICNYGTDFIAAYEYENIYATQFHPEKSQTNGLRLLKNFLEY